MWVSVNRSALQAQKSSQDGILQKPEQRFGGETICDVRFRVG
jgi:hypothetical protein